MFRSRFATTALILAGSTVAVAAVRPHFQDPAAPAPTEQHAMLLELVGQWEGTITMYADGAPGEPARATEIVKPIGEFWTMTHFQCDYMGMPFAGHAQNGYDPVKKEFIGTWIDSAQPNMSIMAGGYDADQKKLTYRWDAADMTGKVVPHRSETVYGKGSYVAEYFLGDGEGTKSMEIKMKRKTIETGATEAGSAKTASFTAGSCCDKAAKAGGACTHPCCVEATSKELVCAACNG